MAATVQLVPPPGTPRRLSNGRYLEPNEVTGEVTVFAEEADYYRGLGFTDPPPPLPPDKKEK